jgi:hypothetical protein
MWLSGVALLATTQPAGAQARWADLGDIGGYRTAIDTAATARLAEGRVTVRLKLYNFAGAGTYRVETRQLDCHTERSRRLAARDFEPPGMYSPVPQSAADSTWKQDPVGSFGREQVRALCRFLGNRGSTGESGSGAGA